MNFDKHLFRCSSLSHIMAGYKTYMEAYIQMKQVVDKLRKRCDFLEAEWDAFPNKETKTAQGRKKVWNNAMDKYLNLVDQYEELGEKKDEIKISEGCKTHLIDVHTCFTFNRPTRDVKSKYLEKGLMLEQKAIAFYSDMTNIFYEKSDIRRDDGYIMGEIDFEDEICIYDTKVSWDAWTFRRNIKYLENPESCPYFPNMQGYMRIWERETAKVVYTLLDTPKKLIEAEKKKMLYDFIGNEQDYEEACIELEKTLTYPDIDPKRKIIEIPIARDEDYINDIPKVVEACRAYLNYLNTI